MNGSNIRPWWIQHHYWSIGTCMLILSLPVDSDAYQAHLKPFLWWSCYQVCSRSSISVLGGVPVFKFMVWGFCRFQLGLGTR